MIHVWFYGHKLALCCPLILGSEKRGSEGACYGQSVARICVAQALSLVGLNKSEEGSVFPWIHAICHD